jgi:hypothetical protein
VKNRVGRPPRRARAGSPRRPEHDPAPAALIPTQQVEDAVAWISEVHAVDWSARLQQVAEVLTQFPLLDCAGILAVARHGRWVLPEWLLRDAGVTHLDPHRVLRHLEQFRRPDGTLLTESGAFAKWDNRILGLLSAAALDTLGAEVGAVGRRANDARPLRSEGASARTPGVRGG